MHRVWVPATVGELRSHMPYSQKIKTENRNHIITNSTKTLKMILINDSHKDENQSTLVIKKKISDSCLQQVNFASAELLPSLFTPSSVLYKVWSKRF